MPITDQITEITPYMRTYYWITIYHHISKFILTLNIYMMKNYKKIVFKHSAASLTKLYYGREGSAVQTFQTNPTPKILGSGFY